MRLPVGPPPAAEPAEDPYAIHRRDAPPRVGAVGARRMSPVLVPARHGGPEQPGLSGQEARLEAVDGAEVSAATAAHLAVREEGEERRRICRRLRQEKVLLDTRSGEDRRRQARRRDDTSPGVDNEV